MSKKIKVTSKSNGVEYLVRLVEKGDRHGRHFCLTHDEERPMVNLYDTKSQLDYDYVGSETEAVEAGAECLGQFVAGYYVHTLLEGIATTGGVCLHGGVARWCIDGDALREAFVGLGLWTPTEKEKPKTSIVVVWDSEDPDTEPTVWVPRSMAAEFDVHTLNKSEETGGRGPSTDKAHIALLEEFCDGNYPDYIQLP